MLPLSALWGRPRVTSTHLPAAHPRAGTITDRVNDMAPTILDVFKARQTIEDALRCERAPVPPPHERVHSPVGPLERVFFTHALLAALLMMAGLSGAPPAAPLPAHRSAAKIPEMVDFVDELKRFRDELEPIFAPLGKVSGLLDAIGEVMQYIKSVWAVAFGFDASQCWDRP